MSELLPCPFCGGEAAIEEYDYYDDGPDYSVQCTNITCACSGPYRFWSTKEEAVEAWNRRDACFHCQYGMKPMTEENMRELGWVRERTCQCTTDDRAWCFACSECGKAFPRWELKRVHDHGEINYCPNCGARVVRE